VKKAVDISMINVKVVSMYTLSFHKFIQPDTSGIYSIIQLSRHFRDVDRGSHQPIIYHQT
jgi:hypothetical protein